MGGSVEFPLEYHLAKIAGQMDELDFTQLPENKKLDDDTNFKYAIGGLFCKLAFENYGKESLMTLMNSGKSDEEFFAALRTVFNVERDDLDAFVRKELQAFRSKE